MWYNEWLKEAYRITGPLILTGGLGASWGECIPDNLTLQLDCPYFFDIKSTIEEIDRWLLPKLDELGFKAQWW